MKTVHEYLCEIDSEELANQYMADFPPDDLEWLSHKDMLIGEYYDHRKQAIRTFVDKLRSIKPCQSEDGETKIFIAYRIIEDFCKDVDFSMVYEKELKEDLSNAKFYYLAKNTPSIVFSQRRDLGGDELAQKMS